MGAKMTTPKEDVAAIIRKHTEAIKASIVKRLIAIGDICVSDARANGNYTDRTGNLRSSVGYVVAKDGKVVASSDFDSIGGATIGPRAGRSLAESVASQTRGLVLVLVAGMNYAQYVADKGFNVLDSAGIIAEQMVRQLNVPRVSW
jgi:hypothetical protein